jgi:hypothetical protein
LHHFVEPTAEVLFFSSSIPTVAFALKGLATVGSVGKIQLLPQLMVSEAEVLMKNKPLWRLK